MSSVSDLPRCLLPLRTEEAQQEYDLLGQALVQAGRLTMGMHRGLSSYAAQFDGIIRAAQEGKQMRASWFTQLDRARAELKLDELEKATAAAPTPRPNKFARSGFSTRRPGAIVAGAK